MRLAIRVEAVVGGGSAPVALLCGPVPLADFAVEGGSEKLPLLIAVPLVCLPVERVTVPVGAGKIAIPRVTITTAKIVLGGGHSGSR